MCYGECTYVCTTCMYMLVCLVVCVCVCVCVCVHVCVCVCVCMCVYVYCTDKYDSMLFSLHFSFKHIQLMIL